MTDWTRRTAAGVAALAVAFAAGVGAGTLVDDDADPAASPPPAPALFADLGLNPEQQAHVDSVLAATRAAAGAVLEDARLELTALATDALDAIDPVLSPDQIETVRTRIRENRAGR